MDENTPIRLGIDIGSRSPRVAYVYPDGERTVVNVPETFRVMKRYYPISLPTRAADLYASRFFPSLCQQLERGLAIALGAQKWETWDLVANLLAEAIEGAEQYGSRETDGVMLAYPMWADGHVIGAFRNAMASSGKRCALCSEAAAAAEFFRERHIGGRETATIALVSAGYSGSGFAVARNTSKGVRILAEGGEQGLMAGNAMDFTVLQTALRVLEENRITLADVKHPTSLAQLLEVVDQAKRGLCRDPETWFTIPRVFTPGSDKALRFRLDGKRYDELVQATHKIAKRLWDDILEESSVSAEEIQYVVMTGGTTHTPSFQDCVKADFPNASLRHLPDVAVSGGAALLSLHCSFEEDGKDLPRQRNMMFLPNPVALVGLVHLDTEAAEEEESSTGAEASEKAPADETSVEEAAEPVKTGAPPEGDAGQAPIIEAIREIRQRSTPADARRLLLGLRDVVEEELRLLPADR